LGISQIASLEQETETLVSLEQVHQGVGQGAFLELSIVGATQKNRFLLLKKNGKSWKMHDFKLG